MGDYLTENSVFTCVFGFGMVKLGCGENTNTKVFSNDSKILTDNCEINSRIGMCYCMARLAKNNGIPEPCDGQVNRWQNSVGAIKFCGRHPLTVTSSCFCKKWFGKIFPIPLPVTATNGIHTIVSPLPSLVLAQLAGDEKKTETVNHDVAGGGVAAGGATATGAKPMMQQNIAQAGETMKAEDDSKKEADKDSLCPGCEKKDTCKYRNASTEVNNDSVILRQNYEKKIKTNLDVCDRHYLDVKQKYPQYIYAAHHIISGNQVFKQYPEVVKMANFCGYDINNAFNCIMLVSKQDEYGKSTDYGKDVKKETAMDDTRLQWHLGGHSYGFSGDEIRRLKPKIEQYLKHPLAGALKDYAALLREEIAKINASLSQNKVCRDTPQQKSGFIRRMNGVSQKVKNYLHMFSNDFRDSYPYYVSKPAYKHAFDRSESGKIILVRKTEGGYSLERYKFELETGSNELKFTPFVLKSSGSHIGQFTGEDSKKCILFCEDVCHFVFIGAAKKNLLPFELLHDKDFQFYVNEDRDSDTILRDDDHKLQAWLNMRQVENQMSAVQKIKERLGGGI